MAQRKKKNRVMEQIFKQFEGRNASKWIYLLAVLCAGLLLADVFYHRHSELTYEALFAFYSWFGLGAGIVLAVLAIIARAALERDGDYYDR